MDEQTELPTAPALAFSISAVLGTTPGDPQIAFQSMFDFEADEATVNAGLDKVVKVIKRQKAIAEIERLEQENRRNERMVGLDKASLKAAEELYAKQRKDLTAEASRLMESIPGIKEKAETTWRESGRQGEYKPNNSTTTAIDRTKKDAEGIHIKLANLDLERSNALNAVDQKTKQWRDEIAQNNEEIGRLTALVG